MTAMYMIFATLATAALAKGPIECNFCEHTKAWCSGAVGQLLLFHLPSTANTEIKLIKDDKHMILKIVKNQKITLHEEYVNQSQLLRNGTFILGNAMRKHSGEYVMEEFGPNGILQKKVDVHLEIQALVSKPAVSQMCLSAEQMKVSCSSEGDGVEFILTLDGIFLMQMNQLADSQSLTGNAAKQAISSGVSVNLYDQLTGNLMCQVRNNVSRDETSLQLGGCKASNFHLSHVTMAVIASIAALLLILTAFLGVKHFNKKPRTMTVNEGQTENAIVYSNVREVKNTRTPRSNSHQNSC